MEDNHSAENNNSENIRKTGDCEIEFIVKTVRLLSAGIGNRPKNNRFLGWTGLMLWLLNNAIHFSLDFYEAKFVFHVSWASTVALFLLALFACSVNSVKYSIPWFIRALRKLSRENRYPETVKKLTLYFKVVRIFIFFLSIGAAMGQFGCYAYDGALDLSFNDGSPSNQSTSTGDTVPKAVTIIANILRATSLVHIFYGFWFFLLIHMAMIFMILLSMNEYIETMAIRLRETPVTLTFSEAINSFAVRSRFVHHASSNTTGIFTVLLVVCSTSFVLNAYNYLFLKKYAIYIWFALAPLIWAVTPLVGAAYVTKEYQRYKLVVVNAWVDVPDDKEDNDEEISRYFRENSLPMRQNCRENTNSSENQLVNNNLETKNTFKSRVKKKHLDLNNKTEKKNRSYSHKLEIKKCHSSIELRALDLNMAQNSSLDLNAVPNRLSKRNAFVWPSQTEEETLEDVNKPQSSTSLRFEVGQRNFAFQEREIPEIQTEKNNRKNEFRKVISAVEEPELTTITSTSVPDLKTRLQTSHLFSGIAKTYSRWRARVKAKRKFNFEKYLTYLDITLPTVGFSIGGVVITWDAVSGFCFLLFTLVGIFAQEAFFGG